MEYENVSRGKLKLKGVSDHKIKKKKKKKDKEKELTKMYENMASTSSQESRPARVDTRTKAEIAFDKLKEKKRAEQILEKAAKSHKERIIEFNQHLDSLTEHFDIPKVSWTK